MGLIAILGVVGTIIDLIRAMPQLARLIRARNSSGVAVDTSGASFVVGMGWTAYGFITHQPFVALASGIVAGIFFAITLTALRFGRSTSEFKVTPIWLIVMLLSSLLFGIDGLGATLSISVLISNIPQIQVAYKESNLSGLSLWTWLLNLSGGLTWCLYAILQHDATITTSAFLQSVTSGIVIALKITHQIAQTNKLSADNEVT